MITDISFCPVLPADKSRISTFLREHWGSEEMVSRCKLYDCSELPGFVAIDSQENILGLVTYAIRNRECEMLSLDSIWEGQGIGTTLMNLVENEARKLNCKLVRLITSNDNLKAAHYYQKRGYRIMAIHLDAVTRARELKPSIPLIGLDGIPIADEIELIKTLE